MVTARSAAMALNRLADRELDAANPRTAGRHLPAGLLSVARVRMFAAANMAMLCRWHAPVLAESAAALSRRARAGLPLGLQLRQAIHRRWPISGSALPSAFRPSRRGSRSAATQCSPIRPICCPPSSWAPPC